jgi:hypothetical protein
MVENHFNHLTLTAIQLLPGDLIDVTLLLFTRSDLGCENCFILLAKAAKLALYLLELEVMNAV